MAVDKKASSRRDSNPQPPDYKARALRVQRVKFLVKCVYISPEVHLVEECNYILPALATRLSADLNRMFTQDCVSYHKWLP